jgi:four helix bundle protein
MLRIADVMVEVIREVRPLVEEIGRHDRDLERQVRRALSSVTANIGEGSGQRGGRRPSHYSIALGSAQEAWMQLRTAEAWGYIGPLPEKVREGLGRTIATLVKVSR